MTSSKSVPRLLQRPPVHPDPSESQPDAPQPRVRRQKGDLRTPDPSSNPSRDRETGDLEQAERETHGEA